MADYFVGLDLGQVQDYTAIAVVGHDQKYLEAKRKRREVYDRLRASSERPWDAMDLKVVEQMVGREAGPAPTAPTFEVRHLERVPLRTLYTTVARRVKGLMTTPPLRGNAELAVDATGVGVAVTDQLVAEGLSFKSVVITAGEKELSEAYNRYRVPKRNLISVPQVLLQNRKLKIAPTLPEASTLVEELLNYRYKITDAGNDTYGAWREGTHDDLVLALALAVWAARRPYVEPTPELAAPTEGAPDFGDEPDWLDDSTLIGDW